MFLGKFSSSEFTVALLTLLDFLYSGTTPRLVQFVGALEIPVGYSSLGELAKQN